MNTALDDDDKGLCATPTTKSYPRDLLGTFAPAPHYAPQELLPFSPIGSVERSFGEVG